LIDDSFNRKTVPFFLSISGNHTRFSSRMVFLVLFRLDLSACDADGLVKIDV